VDAAEQEVWRHLVEGGYHGVDPVDRCGHCGGVMNITAGDLQPSMLAREGLRWRVNATTSWCSSRASWVRSRPVGPFTPKTASFMAVLPRYAQTYVRSVDVNKDAGRGWAVTSRRSRAELTACGALGDL